MNVASVTRDTARCAAWAEGNSKPTAELEVTHMYGDSLGGDERPRRSDSDHLHVCPNSGAYPVL